MRASSVLILLETVSLTSLAVLPKLAGLPIFCGDISVLKQWVLVGQFGPWSMYLWVVCWLACMILAMMILGLGRPIKNIIAQSLPRRTGYLLAVFLVSYIFVWLLPLAALMSGAALLQSNTNTAALFVIALTVCYSWTCTPLYQNAMNRCHAMPTLRSFGLAAVYDTLHFGMRHGGWCVVSCWPLMAVPFLAGSYSNFAMIACAIASTLLRISPMRVPRWRIGGMLPTLWSATQCLYVALSEIYVVTARTKGLATVARK